MRLTLDLHGFVDPVLAARGIRDSDGLLDMVGKNLT